MNIKTISIVVIVGLLLIGIGSVLSNSMKTPEIKITPVSQVETNTVQMNTMDNVHMDATTSSVQATTTVKATVTPKPTPPTETTPTAKPGAPMIKPTDPTVAVSIKGYNYEPKILTVKKGTTVTWTNQDIAKHTVTGESGGPASAFFGEGETYSYTFNDVGTFNYFCEPHPYMKASIIVTQ